MVGRRGLFGVKVRGGSVSLRVRGQSFRQSLARESSKQGKDFVHGTMYNKRQFAGAKGARSWGAVDPVDCRPRSVII